MKAPPISNDADGGARPIAMVGCDEAQTRAWGQRLRLMGCTPVSFDSSAGFLHAATHGTTHFDLLLVVLKDEGAWPLLSSMCQVLRMPIFVVANALQRELLAEVLSATQPESQGPGVDFAVLPVDDFEVELRVREALRRNETLLHPQPKSALFGNYRFIGNRKLVLHRGEEIRLKPREFELALMLFRNAGQLLEREWLLGSLWPESRVERKSRVLDCCVANIRRKLSLHKASEFVLHSVYGRGYELRHAAAAPRGADDAVDGSGFPNTSSWLAQAATA